MIRFESTKPHTVVWHGQKNKAIAEFKNHVFETTDKETVQYLLEQGYTAVKGDVEPYLKKTKSDADEDFQALKDKARDLGIGSWHVKSKETLLADIAVKEAELAANQGAS